MRCFILTPCIRATCAPDLFFSANEILSTATARQVGRMHQKRQNGWASATAISSQLPAETFPGHLRVLCSQDAVCTAGIHSAIRGQSQSTSKARICGP
ncbi:hypothetical protein BDZ89DRAFT_1070617 [Hymenopellis radicata]|nr:hypothetical protein BDZ89DRAFT_1070617 [Hymenopellis radicata]